MENLEFFLDNHTIHHLYCSQKEPVQALFLWKEKCNEKSIDF